MSQCEASKTCLPASQCLTPSPNTRRLLARAPPPPTAAAAQGRRVFRSRKRSRRNKLPPPTCSCSRRVPSTAKPFGRTSLGRSQTPVTPTPSRFSGRGALDRESPLGAEPTLHVTNAACLYGVSGCSCQEALAPRPTPQLRAAAPPPVPPQAIGHPRPAAPALAGKHTQAPPAGPRPPGCGAGDKER